MKNSTAKSSDEPCTDYGGDHAAPTPEFNAQRAEISKDVERIGELVADAVAGESGHAVALALFTLGVLALRGDICDATNDPGEQVAFTANLGIRFFESALQSALLTTRATTTDPTSKKYPALAENAIKVARQTSQIEVIRSERVKPDGGHDLGDIPESAFQK